MQPSTKGLSSPQVIEYKFLVCLFTVWLFSYFCCCCHPGALVICQKGNPNLFPDMSGWPSKLFFKLFSFPISQFSLHSVPFRVSVTFRYCCLHHLLAECRLLPWDWLLSAQEGTAMKLSGYTNPFHVCLWSVAQQEAYPHPGCNRGALKSELHPWGHTENCTSAAGKLDIFFVFTLNWRNELQSLSNVSSPAVS